MFTLPCKKNKKMEELILERNTYCWSCKKPTNTMEGPAHNTTICSDCGKFKKLHIDTRGRIKFWQFCCFVIAVIAVAFVAVLVFSWLVNLLVDK